MIMLALLALILTACTPPEADKSKSLSEEEVRRYLMENPKITLEIMENALVYRQARDKEQKAQALERARPLLTQTGLGSVAQGRGDITLVEFFDYHCGYCKKAYPALMRAIEQDKRVRIIYKEFPILGELSRIAARAAVASARQGEDRYLAFHHALMTMSGRLDEKRIFAMARKVGLDLAKLRRDMEDPKIDEAFAQNRELARSLGIQGTPSFVLLHKEHMELLRGARQTEELTALFAQLRAR